MEKINTDYKRPIWKIEATLFNMRKPWLSSFKEKCLLRFFGFAFSTNSVHMQSVLYVLYVRLQSPDH